jgi:ABC-type antimicrobial peptide transport system permease subunit
VMRQGAWIAALGAALGVAAGVAGARFLGSILYGTSASDPFVLVAAPAVLVLATLVACWLPARRAAAVDPARTLVQP